MNVLNQQEEAERRSVQIDLGARSYSIVIGSGLLGDPAVWDAAGTAECAAIVSNTTVAPLYADKLAGTIDRRFSRIIRIELPDGELHKNMNSLNLIFDRLLSETADRKTVLFALGGGVVGDVAGFAAASYMRGIPLIQVPTTLLAQVDSSIGGKTGVNHPLGKNMIGAFYQPKLVVADLDALRSLPNREFSAGLAEVIKYGPIIDSEFLAWIESNIDKILERDVSALAHTVQRSCELKALIVAQDEQERGMRAILNLGHTFGHAIEVGLGYGKWLHGEAVGCGMVMALDLSARLGLVSACYTDRLKKLIARAGLPVVGPNLGVDHYLELMRLDKKSEGGEIRFVLIEKEGQAVVRSAPEAMVRQVITSSCQL